QTGSGVLFVPEPISSDHNQVEARLSYAVQQLRVSLGYYGSFYQNDFGSLTPTLPGTLFNPVGTQLPVSSRLAAILGNPVALPPDNQAPHLDLTGVYLLGPSSTVNFKLGHSRALQSDNFLAAGLGGAPAGVNDLGGRVDTTLAQVGFSARPLAKLS